MNEGFVLDTPEGIEAFRLLSLKGRLHLETLGMRCHGPSALSQVREEFGLTGNKSSVYAQYVQLLRERGVLKSAKE